MIRDSNTYSADLIDVKVDTNSHPKPINTLEDLPKSPPPPRSQAPLKKPTAPRPESPHLLLPKPLGQPTKRPPPAAAEHKPPPSFYEIAFEKGTDEVTTHAYQDIYTRHLPTRRSAKIKLLELGSGGCSKTRHGAARAAYYTWTEYFPNAELYFVESDAECAAALRGELEDATVVAGDLTDGKALAEFWEKYGLGFDLVVGGGGLGTGQQVASLETLWRTVKPGGVYFCEYLETGYLEKEEGDRVGSKSKGRESMVTYLHGMIEDLMYPDPNLEAYNLKGTGVSWPRKVQFEEVESVKHIDCEKQICALLKRAD